MTELIDVAEGLWVWRTRHPDWRSHVDWEPLVASTCVESGGEVVVADALAPPPDDRDVWSRLDARPPTVAVVVKPDHVRSVDLFRERYGARGFGPFLYWPDNVPAHRLQGYEPGDELPGGAVGVYDGRGRGETPLWFAERRVIVCADALTERAGELRVWGTPWHEERVVPALRAWLELPFDWLVVSHGRPVHDRAAFERALALPPWTG